MKNIDLSEKNLYCIRKLQRNKRLMPYYTKIWEEFFSVLVYNIPLVPNIKHSCSFRSYVLIKKTIMMTKGVSSSSILLYSIHISNLQLIIDCKQLLVNLNEYLNQHQSFRMKLTKF